MAFSRIDTRDERLTALILGDLPNVVWTPTLSTAGAEQTELQDNITFQVGTRFRYLGSIYELTAPMSIPASNRRFGWVYPNISTGQFEILTTKRVEDAGVAGSRPPIGMWARDNQRQAFLPMNPSQDRQYPVSDNRDILAGSGSRTTIIVQNRARIVLGVTQNQPDLTVNTVIGNLENDLRKNGESEILSVSIARNNSEIATATLDRGIWQTTAGLHADWASKLSSITKHMGASRDTIMSFYKVSDSEKRKLAYQTDKVSRVEWTPFLTQGGAEETELEDRVTIHSFTRFWHCGHIYQVSKPTRIEYGNHTYGWVYANIETGKFEVSPVKKVYKSEFESLTTPIGIWARHNGKQVFLPTDITQDKGYPRCEARHIFVGNPESIVIVAQGRVEITIDASNSKVSNALDVTLNNLEKSFAINKQSQFVAERVARRGSNIAIEALDRGIWRGNNILIPEGVTATIGQFVAII